MHQLTGDFYTVGELLDRTLKSIGMSLGISTNLQAVTAQYVGVRLEQKRLLLKPATNPYTHKIPRRTKAQKVKGQILILSF